MSNMEPLHKNVQTLSDKKKAFANLIEIYLANNNIGPGRYKTNELEIKFGTNYKVAKPISKMNYDNVIKFLYSNGFKCENPQGFQSLRIYNEYTNPKGETQFSNVRAEINGTDLISDYCEHNSIQRLIDKPSTINDKIIFLQKTSPRNENDKPIRNVDFEDFNLRVSYKIEQTYNVHTNLARKIISNWDNSLKIFRCMNRIRFYHDEYPIYADLSIVKTSKKSNHNQVPTYTIQEAELFNNTENYEIEIELDNNKIGIGTQYDTVDKILNILRKSIRIVLSGIQNTNYPIPYDKQSDLLQSYLSLVHQSKYEKRNVYTEDFIGPNSFTLQVEHIVESSDNMNISNIRNDYTVTDKADGDRKLLFVTKEGEIYLIDTNMNIMFTGSKTKDPKLFNSLIDGEYITKNKKGNNIHLFMAFDIYYINNETVRHYMFYPKEGDVSNKYRLKLLWQYVDLLKIEPVVKQTNIDNCQHIYNFQVKVKEFKKPNENQTIFMACNQILSNTMDAIYEYNTDGLIFTPAYKAVGAVNEKDKPGPLRKFGWECSFKWKPPEFNTIDFLVTTKKDNNNVDIINNIFQSGVNNDNIQYKTLVLRCGFNPQKNGFVNPYQNIIDDNYVFDYDINDKKLQPFAFQPTEPFDNTAHLCNIRLTTVGNQQYMMTEENEYFEDNTIVEFKYVHDNNQYWKWVPIKVRHDKTFELKTKGTNFGNNYKVANDNWYSIHNPISTDMISSGINIPKYYRNDEVYYNKQNKNRNTKSLQEFHNLCVKSKLIEGVSNRGDIIIDYAVGKGGDMSKWVYSNLNFILGIDISKDNIHNQLDGACARYIKARLKYKELPKALFVVGNSGCNIRDGTALNTVKDKSIVDAIFGNGPKDINILGKGVYNNYGVATNGFNVSSCQFALHYFFENKKTLLSFIKNIVECTKLNGHFIATCYDGKTVFDKLKNKMNGESLIINKNAYKICEITKMYDKTGFPDDELSLNYPIKVLQESINKSFIEYLVNSTYFIEIMNDYGFVIIEKEEANKLGIPNGTGLFNDFYKEMEKDIEMNFHKKTDYKTAMNMSSEEKEISFMNRYFVFKKIRNVDINMVNEIHLKDYDDSNDVDHCETQDDNDNIPMPTKRKLTLKSFTPPNDEK